MKWDGYRALITKDGDRVRIFSRSGAEYSTRLPRMVEAFANLPASSAVLDGDLVYVGADGQAKFYALMREMRRRGPDETALIFSCFDVLHIDGVDLRPLPLSERRKDLERLCRKARVPFLKLVEQFSDGQVLFQYAALMASKGLSARSWRHATQAGRAAGGRQSVRNGGETMSSAEAQG